MINVVIPILENQKKYYPLIAELGETENVNVLIGVREGLSEEVMRLCKEFDNVKVVKFEDGSTREGIINALKGYLVEGSIIVLRKPLSLEEFDKFVSQRMDVVTCEKRRGKVKQFFFDLWQKMIRVMLGVRLYEGDSSAIYIGKDLSSVVRETGNFSFSTRVNRWRGIKQGVVATKEPPAKTPINKKSNALYIISQVIALAVALTVTFCVVFLTDLSIMGGLFLFCLDFVCLAIIFILTIMMVFNNMAGKRVFEDAERVYDEEDFKAMRKKRVIEE